MTSRVILSEAKDPNNRVILSEAKDLRILWGC